MKKQVRARTIPDRVKKLEKLSAILGLNESGEFAMLLEKVMADLRELHGIKEFMRKASQDLLEPDEPEKFRESFSKKHKQSIKQAKRRQALNGSVRNVCFALGGKDIYGYRRAMCDAKGSFVDGNARRTEQPFILDRKSWNTNPKIFSRYVIHDEEAKVIRQIFSLRQEGLGGMRIAKMLDASGVAPYSAAKWGKTTVQRILSNRIYCGYFEFHGSSQPESAVMIHDPYVAIVSKEQFNRAQ